MGGTQRLPRLIGASKAKELIITGDPISAEKALQIGLVDHVVPKGEGLNYAKKLAEKINRFSLPALIRIKKAINEGLQAPLWEGIQLEAQLFEEVFQTEDIKEGVQAFIEKREASFSHR